MEIVMMPIAAIKPYENNPRLNSDTVAFLVDLIPKVGFNVPLVVDPDGVIVKGHTRYAAAKQLGMTELPCVVTTADPEAIRMDRIADNRIAELTEWDKEMLRHELNIVNVDMGVLGFKPEDLGRIDAGSPADVEVATSDLADAEKRIKESVGNKDEYYELTCPKCNGRCFITKDEYNKRLVNAEGESVCVS